MPLVFIAWAIGHAFIWGALRLAAAGRRRGAASRSGQSWPFGLLAALVGTAAATILGVIQIVGTAIAGKWYPFSQAGLWVVMLLVWAAHSACFSALLLRRRWSRWLGAALAFGWAALLALQIVEHFRIGSADTSGLAIATLLMASLLLFGFHLLLSGRVESFLGD